MKKLVCHSRARRVLAALLLVAVNAPAGAAAAGQVSVTDFGSVGNGVADDTAAFTRAAAYAAGMGATVVVPAPSVSYLLKSSPIVARNTSIAASPAWFSGPGLLPFHRFIARSEGIDPHAFSIKDLHYVESVPNEKKRKWSVAGWVDVADAPAPGFAGTLTDAVGVDGRGRASAPDARVWGVTGLGQLDPGVSGTAQAYAAEFDINNNAAHADSDANPIALGVMTASGGAFRPRAAHWVTATRTPTNGLGDNRFTYGMRFYRDAVSEAAIFTDDENRGDAMRIPATARGLHWTANANLVNYYMRVNANNHHLELTIDRNQAFDMYNSANQKILAIGEARVALQKPLAVAVHTYAAVPATIDAGLADMITVTAAGTIAGGITGGAAGQVITLINESGGVVTIGRNVQMRTAGGKAVALTANQTVQFAFNGTAYFQIGVVDSR